MGRPSSQLSWLEILALESEDQHRHWGHWVAAKIKRLVQVKKNASGELRSPSLDLGNWNGMPLPLPQGLYSASLAINQQINPNRFLADWGNCCIFACIGHIDS